jgi:hypothetical protein
MKSSITLNANDEEKKSSFNSSDSELENESRNCFQSMRSKISALFGDGLSGVVDEQILKEQ